jgi:hypothetical protein
MSTSNVFYVYGNYGTLNVEVGSGKVIGYEADRPDDPEYADIAYIDITAYEKEYRLRISPGDHVCIMDLNYWLHDGRYLHTDYLLDHPDHRKCDWPRPIILLSTHSG